MRALCLFIAAGGLLAQTPAAPLIFDVASVKPSAPSTPGITEFLPGGGYEASAVTLKRLIAQAFEINGYQLSGGPSWIDSARFDITARPGEPGTNRQIPERLRNLLADRFQLVIHRETKELPEYALVIAKGGSKIRQSEDGKSIMSGTPGRLSGQRVGISMLAAWLSGHVGRPVIDKTGLTGRYDFELKWTPDAGQRLDGPGPLPPGVPQPPPPDPNSPSVFTAITEQLGLRLASEKGPVETFVIDRVEKPSEN